MMKTPHFWSIIARAGGGVLVLALISFVSAGRLDYWQAWYYITLSVVALVVTGVLASQNPALIEERLNPGKGIKGWDKLYFALTTPLYLVVLIVAGLDVGRWGWTGPLPWWLYLLSGVGYLLGQAIFLWARQVNHFFSSVVRIQSERGQTVCQDGPYRYVRHPGYVGGILIGLAMPLMLGSLWALIPQVIAVLLLIWRTGKEDRLLQAELPGYSQYTQTTRYRLLPGVW